MKYPFLSDEFVNSYRTRIPPFGGNGLGYLVYKRTYARLVPGEGRLEEWHETIARCVEGAQAIGADYSTEEARRLYDHVFNMRGIFAGRGLWQLGTPLVEKIGAPSLQNCWATSISSIESFEFLMYQLMLGGGVGFTVERSAVHNLPKVKPLVKITHERTNDADIIVPDKREGWSKLLHAVLKSYFYTGKSFTWSSLLIRSYGAPLGTFGGTASGPEILIEGIEKICAILNLRVGKKIRSLDALDICNVIGKVVVAGSARRSAQLAAGDPDDYLFLRAKNWGKGDIPDYRANSNNSVFADSYDEIIPEFWAGYDGTGEPYGLLNRRLAQTYGRVGEKADDREVTVTNPCGEIFLETAPDGSGEACNLADIFLPNVTSQAQLIDIAKLLYKTQKAITTLSFPHEGTTKIVQKNRRLGLGITGWMQSTEKQVSWVSSCYDSLKLFDLEWSKKKGLPLSIKLTSTKPSGTVSLLPFVTPGIHPAYDSYFIRRVRIGSNDPLVKYCRDQGLTIKYDIGIDGKENHRLCVVEFPCEAPKGTILSKNLTAVEHLEWQAMAQSVWSDNAVSATIYYKKNELPEIKEWMRDNYDKRVKSVSFLLHSEHGFVMAPYESIEEDQYKMKVSKMKPFKPFEAATQTEALDVECEGGACPVR